MSCFTHISPVLFTLLHSKSKKFAVTGFRCIFQRKSHTTGEIFSIILHPRSQIVTQIIGLSQSLWCPYSFLFNTVESLRVWWKLYWTCSVCVMSLCSFRSKYFSLRYTFKEICFSCDEKCRTAFVCSIRYCSWTGYYKIRSRSIYWLSYSMKTRAVAVRFIQHPDRLRDPVSPPNPLRDAYWSNSCILCIRGKGTVRYRRFPDIRMLILGPG